MASRARKQKTIERRWRERFGEPPSLLTDPDLMLRILDANPPSTRSGGGGGPQVVVEGAAPAATE